ncbi:hypothetical protein [Rugamonas sp. DEMB1]|uniref:hypothetical protein n=1 Tax=Rugamonas sp. DEMB1 TaxID=3039386 RepID=UPI00244734DD|nr:hypothetical protein [Rugamonas sp. DEMB1]WGG48140.1 hypothetical protein QC826_15455 [Rugamonas sp. DEMB1]
MVQLGRQGGGAAEQLAQVQAQAGQVGVVVELVEEVEVGLDVGLVEVDVLHRRHRQLHRNVAAEEGLPVAGVQVLLVEEAQIGRVGAGEDHPVRRAVLVHRRELGRQRRQLALRLAQALAHQLVRIDVVRAVDLRHPGTRAMARGSPWW